MGWRKPDHVRLFGRMRAFTVECPRCGRLLLVGRGQPDDKQYDRVSGILTCPFIKRHYSTHKLTDRPGCGLRVLVGLVLYPIKASRSQGRPTDQRPDWSQLQELRQAAATQYRPTARARATDLNRVETIEVELPEQLGDLAPDERLDREPED